jgi:hypothetical protein
LNGNDTGGLPARKEREIRVVELPPARPKTGSSTFNLEHALKTGEEVERILAEAHWHHAMWTK